MFDQDDDHPPPFLETEGAVSKEEMIALSDEVSEWFAGPLSGALEQAAEDSRDFLERNTQSYNEDGALLPRPYVSAHVPKFDDPLDALLGRASMVRLVYSQGLMRYLWSLVNAGVLDHSALDGQRFVFDLRTIELCHEMVRRQRNAGMMELGALGLGEITARFYASRDARKDMRRKAVQAINLGIWTVKEAPRGYTFAAGPVLTEFMDTVMEPFVSDHPTLGRIAHD